MHSLLQLALLTSSAAAWLWTSKDPISPTSQFKIKVKCPLGLQRFNKSWVGCEGAKRLEWVSFTSDLSVQLNYVEESEVTFNSQCEYTVGEGVGTMVYDSLSLGSGIDMVPSEEFCSVNGVRLTDCTGDTDTQWRLVWWISDGKTISILNKEFVHFRNGSLYYRLNQVKYGILGQSFWKVESKIAKNCEQTLSRCASSVAVSRGGLGSYFYPKLVDAFCAESTNKSVLLVLDGKTKVILLLDCVTSYFGAFEWKDFVIGVLVLVCGVLYWRKSSQPVAKPVTVQNRRTTYSPFQKSEVVYQNINPSFSDSTGRDNDI